MTFRYHLTSVGQEVAIRLLTSDSIPVRTANTASRRYDALSSVNNIEQLELRHSADDDPGFDPK